MTLRYGLYGVLIVGALALAGDGVASGDGLIIFAGVVTALGCVARVLGSR
jgi:hypothetical protein